MHECASFPLNTNGWLDDLKRIVTPNNVNWPVKVAHSPTFLHVAAKHHFCEVVTWLIEECGANIEARDFEDETPLFDAVRCENKKSVHQLLAYGAKIEAKNARGINPLTCAIRVWPCRVYNAGQEEIIKLLIMYGAKVSWLVSEFIPECVARYISACEKCRQVCVVLLGIRGRRFSMLNNNVKDVIRMIARAIWKTRLADEWVKK